MRARPGAGKGYTVVGVEEEVDVEAAVEAEDDAKPRGGLWPSAWRWLSIARNACAGLPLQHKLLLSFLGFCFLEQVLEVALGIQLTGVGRILLLPVRIAGYAEYLCIVAAPLACALALAAWRWLAVALPNADGEAGQPIAKTLRYAAVGSFVLVAVLALDGDPLVRYALASYALAALAFCLRRVYFDRSLRRTVRTWALFIPLIAHYKALDRWVKYAKVSKDEKKRAHNKLHAKYAPKVYQLMVDLGGLYVKVGQMLSLVPSGVLPEAYTREFKKMQSDCPSRPSEEVQRQIAEALGRPVSDIFSSFGEKPIGTASISQVHRAKLAKDGRDVVVKVQYPDLAQSIDADFNSAELIIRLLDPSKVDEVREAKKHFDDELDFEAEAETLERVHANLAKPFPTVRVPEPIRELCSPTVLVMTFIPGTSFLDGIMQMAEAICKAVGTSVDDVVSGVAKMATEKPGKSEEQQAQGGEVADAPQPLALEAAAPAAAGGQEGSEQAKWATKLGSVAVQRVNPVRVLQTCMSTSRTALNMGVAIYNFSVGRLGATPLEYRKSLPTFDPVKLSRTIWRVHGHQLIIDGLFNSDPHPGNILIDDSAKRIGLIDFGQICELRLQTRVRFARLLVALVEGDDREIAKRHAQLGFQTRRMSVETLALSARLRFGPMTDDFMKKLEQAKKLEKADTVLRQRYDQNFCMAERLITILRGTSFICGVGKAHCATALWLDMAKTLLKEHGATCLPEEATTDGVELDIEPEDDAGAASPGAGASRPALAAQEEEAAWKLDLVPVQGGEEEEFFEVESEEES